MYMTPLRMAALRLYLTTFGRFAWFGRLLKRIAVRRMIRKASEPHVPSARFFTPDQLKESGK
ncbi:MAG TPA: hypothetical protein PLQ35_11810 [bacterium]|nr:hypothetical protein [bacterium]HQL62970.1 hypothetical protein [bacterium]